MPHLELFRFGEAQNKETLGGLRVVDGNEILFEQLRARFSTHSGLARYLDVSTASVKEMAETMEDVEEALDKIAPLIEKHVHRLCALMD